MESQPVIRCSSCGHNNRPDRRFCTECGRRFGRVCAACGNPIQEEEKFCGNCGVRLGEHAAAARALAAYIPKHLAERILAEQAAIEAPGIAAGERKTITALFADIKGSMEMIEDLDPEDARSIKSSGPPSCLLLDSRDPKRLSTLAPGWKGGRIGPNLGTMVPRREGGSHRFLSEPRECSLQRSMSPSSTAYL